MPARRQRRTEFRRPTDTASSPRRPLREWQPTSVPAPAPAWDETEPPPRRRIQELPPHFPTTSRANCGWIPQPREIPRSAALRRARPAPKIEKGSLRRPPAEARPHADAQVSWWFANKVVPSDPTRQSKPARPASARAAIRRAPAEHRQRTSPQTGRSRDRSSDRRMASECASACRVAKLTSFLFRARSAAISSNSAL